jgi:hypothetical protein
MVRATDCAVVEKNSVQTLSRIISRRMYCNQMHKQRIIRG